MWALTERTNLHNQIELEQKSARRGSRRALREWITRAGSSLKKEKNVSIDLACMKAFRSMNSSSVEHCTEGDFAFRNA